MNHQSKDGRKLSTFQSKQWMKAIGKKRKYKNQAKGEASGNAKIKETDVRWIRSLSASSRRLVCTKLGICERQWYSIRAKEQWRHI
jgi:hypothetical protein